MKKVVRIRFENKTYDVEVEKYLSQKTNLNRNNMNLVKELKNKSRKECKDFFSNYSGEPLSDDSLLSIEDGSGIRIDSQYGLPCVQSSKIIEIGKIYKVKEIVFEADELNLVNCAFLGDVIIKANSKKARVSLDLCFCFGHIRIDGCDKKTNVTVGGSLIDEIEFSGFFEKIVLSQSSFGNTIFYNVDVSRLDLDCCFTEKIRTGYNSKINISSKEMFKVNMEKVFVFGEGIDEWEKYPINLADDRVAKSVDKDTEIAFAEDMAEFIEKNRLYTTANEYAQFLYMKNKISLTGFSKFVYICFGGMVKPWVIVIWLLGITFICGLLYLILGSLSCLSDKIPLYENFFQAMYFSAVTVTSVGYGDIQPQGIAKIIAALEGLAGLLIGGVFCIALTRKYFSR